MGMENGNPIRNGQWEGKMVQNGRAMEMAFPFYGPLIYIVPNNK
jgi:hypothetical protein